ncbi:MAG: hypothetical protein ACI4OS_04275 [Akkermansia sp.]
MRIQLRLMTALLAALPLVAQDEPGGSETEVFDGVPDFEEGAGVSRRPGEVPALFRDDSRLDDNHANQELGINVYTAPSISKIFDQLDNLPAIPEPYVLRDRAENLPTDTGSLAIEMGYLMADGFIAVRSGHMNDIKPIALDLTRFGKAIGVGEKMNAHSAGLLENAEKGKLEEFKRLLASTQSDVNEELAAMRDPDLAHLLAMGGWVRALDAAAAAIEQKFDAKQAAAIFYPDAPAYFGEILTYLNPKTAKKLNVAELCRLLNLLTEQMTLAPGELPTPEQVRAVHETTLRISTLCVGEGHEH